jgi:UDP-N-acetylglucosamine 2-epimerase (hydrolysing)
MKKIVFLTGTRADFGKIKPLLLQLEHHSDFEVFVFVTGMHLQELYGYTLIEIQRCQITNIHTFENHTHESTMDLTLAKTIEGFSAYCKEIQPDLIVVHGDRVETLAGAIVGALNNFLVAHIEGGERSGTVDELIRHSVSKLSHLHFVSNAEAAKRLLQMGEEEQTIFEIGSPDIDIMFSKQLPDIESVKSYYEIPFETYAVVLFHPVTTELDQMEIHAQQLVNALMEDTQNYVVVYPNNDMGNHHIFKAYEALHNHPRFRLFPSLRFEYFLQLLKQAEFIIGNSSAGIREAPSYGVSAINIGTRQLNRATHPCIYNVSYETSAILLAIQSAKPKSTEEMPQQFGEGRSAQLFLEALIQPNFWARTAQKQFRDVH